jgi:hypothetical protein
MDPRPQNRQSGQAIVEAAFMLPLMIFFILCTLQLTLMQQARIAVEYAAFNAARVGVVHNMNNGTDGSDPSFQPTMRNAAVMSILPTYGRTDSMGALVTTRAKFELEALALRAINVPLVKVTILNPKKSDFTAFGAHLNNKEIDFDDMRPAAARATLLSIEVRYMFELRIPFANQMIEAIYVASQTGILRAWTGPDVTHAGLFSPTSGDAVKFSLLRGVAMGNIKDGMQGGLNMGLVSGMASAPRSAVTPRFYFPLYAYYTMRMQSNPFVQWAAP